MAKREMEVRGGQVGAKASSQSSAKGGAEALVAEKRKHLVQYAFDEGRRSVGCLMEFKDESDRAVVILAAAMIDQLLCDILEGALLPVTGSKDELLDNDGALATFSSRIGMCSRLGILDPELARCLQLVRKIRNSFAHEVSGCSLVTGSHSDRVRQLAKELRMLDEFEKLREIAGKTHEGLSADFRASVALIIASLGFGRLMVTRIRLAPITFRSERKSASTQHAPIEEIVPSPSASQPEVDAPPIPRRPRAQGRTRKPAS